MDGEGWRLDLESNQDERICNPARNHSATQPNRDIMMLLIMKLEREWRTP